ncbi:MFS transporter [Streptomyces sp. NPDC087270]|uniref:MFS transporter n=1 Tax=Streptomyces sp. NPDC087270 TaxID=3365774 RepID=UPI00382AED8D
MVESIAEPDPGRGTDPRRWSAFAVCLIAGFMTLLDVSIVNVAMPSMQAGLGVSSGELSWTVTGYTLAFGLVLVPAGRLGDVFGRRTLLLSGLVLFTVTSLACGSALSGEWLVSARLAQGVAGGLLTPQVVGVMQQLFVGRERGVAYGWYAAMIAAATAVGPVAGGLIVQGAGNANGWRWVFLVNVPIGVLAYALGARRIPHDRRRLDRTGGRTVRFDPVGVLLLGAGITSVTLPLTSFGGAKRWPAVGLGVVVLAGFAGWERRCGRRGGQPLINPALLRQRSYVFAALIGVPYFAGYSAIPFITSLYLQQGLGYTALASGAAGVPFAVGAAAGAALSGRFVIRLGRLLVLLGAVTVVIGLAATVVLIRTVHGTPIWLVLLGPFLLAGAGSGVVVGPNLTLALHEVPPSEGGTAAAALQTAQRIGAAVGLAVTSSAFFGALGASHRRFPAAAAKGLLYCIGFIALALVVAAADVAFAARSTSGPPAASPEPAALSR